MQILYDSYKILSLQVVAFYLGFVVILLKINVRIHHQHQSSIACHVHQRKNVASGGISFLTNTHDSSYQHRILSNCKIQSLYTFHLLNFPETRVEMK